MQSFPTSRETSSTWSSNVQIPLQILSLNIRVDSKAQLFYSSFKDIFLQLFEASRCKIFCLALVVMYSFCQPLDRILQ